MKQLFSYKNIEVSYNDLGKGPVILLLHGFLENKKMWTPLNTELLKKNRLLEIDLLGHGQTGNLGYLHTMEEQADMVLALLRSLKLRKFSLIGHSMGGYVALAIASKRPAAVKGLCLLNSTPIGDTPTKQKNRDRAIQAVKHNYKSFINVSIPNLFAEENRNRLKAQITQVKKEAMNMTLQGVIAALEGMKIRNDHSAFLKVANFEKLMIIGEADPVLNKDKLLKLASLTNSKSVILPGGHMSHLESKIALTIALKRFINQL
ncbi:alpha/beta hydrolase [Flavobacteriaceae bacterium F08102]|nr:alpha/beta hydrolase [Flavobacteriaceae bacterium F08102]